MSFKSGVESRERVAV